MILVSRQHMRPNVSPAFHHEEGVVVWETVSENGTRLIDVSTGNLSITELIQTIDKDGKRMVGLQGFYQF